jgi:hypothetical protein
MFDTSRSVLLRISGQEIPRRRCSTSQDVSRTFLVSSQSLSKPSAVRAMKYSPPARGDHTFEPSRSVGFRFAGDCQIGHFASSISIPLFSKCLHKVMPNWVVIPPRLHEGVCDGRPVLCDQPARRIDERVVDAGMHHSQRPREITWQSRCRSGTSRRARRLAAFKGARSGWSSESRNATSSSMSSV